MLNTAAATAARNQLKAAVEDHNSRQKQVEKKATALYELRRESSRTLIGDVEAFINTLANVPTEFSRAFVEYKVEFSTFLGVVEAIDSQMQDINLRGGSAAGAGIAAGATTALLGPTAAMAIATTFGTASTGTAIASLSGVAATNAALAWLGGGALAAGGGGISAGGALLALAGPIGWALAGAAAVGSAAYVANSNNKTIEEANRKRAPIEAGIVRLKSMMLEITGLYELTITHVRGTESLFARIQAGVPKSFYDFTEDQLEMVGALINHVRSLSALLNKTVVVCE